MFPKWHILFGAIFAFLIWIFSPKIGIIGAILIFLSSVLIDIDHYLYYLYRKKNFNLKRAYKWFKDNEKRFADIPPFKINEVYFPVCWLHGFEIMIILAILSLFWNFFLFILVGFTFHLLLDIILCTVEFPEFKHYLYSSSYKYLITRNRIHIEDVK